MADQLTTADRSRQVGATDDRMSERHARWPWVAFVTTAVAGVSSAAVYPRPGAPWIVLLGIDGFGWSFLLAATAVTSFMVAVGGLTWLLVRSRDTWWSGLISSLAILLITGIGLLGTFVGLFGAALSFKNTYRDIQGSDGRTIVIQHFAGWRGNDFIDAGYRTGPFVSFNARGDTSIRQPNTNLSQWVFSTSGTPTGELVRYALQAGATPNRTFTIDQ